MNPHLHVAKLIATQLVIEFPNSKEPYVLEQKLHNLSL